MRACFFRLLLFITAALPLRLAHQCAAILAGLGWYWSKKQKDIILTNITLCFPKLDSVEQQLLGKQSLTETVKTFFELGRVWRRYGSDISPLIKSVEGEQILQQAMAKGNGVLLAAPHFGNWEVLNLWLAKFEGFAFLYKPPGDPAVAKILLKQRGQSGAKQIAADKRGVRQVLEVLKSGGLMAILPDQQPKSGQGVFAPFMQQNAYTMSLFSKVAQKTQAPVVMAVARRLSKGKGFSIHLKAVGADIYSPDLNRSVATLNTEIEQQLKIAPAQYQWSYKRFSIQPDGNSPYSPPLKK